MCKKKLGSIRILHLSDLHVMEWNHRLEDEVNALLRDIHENFQEIDYVVITGDVSFSGKMSQFDIVAEKIFPRLRSAAHVAEKKFVIVPGNHDVDRDRITPVLRLLSKENFARDNLPDDVIIDVLKSGIFDNYNEFIKKTGAMKGAQCENGFYSLVTSSSRTNIEKIFFACLNTAWSCMGDSNKGDIFITKRQLDYSREKIPDRGLKVAVMHHDTEWVHESESDICEQMAKEFDVILMGHIHRESSVLRKSPNSEALLLTGAAFSNDDTALYTGYNVYDVNSIDSQVEIFYRKYVEQRQKFVPNVDYADDGMTVLPYRSAAPLSINGGRPIAYTYLPTVKHDHIVAQLKKTQGLDRPIYIPPNLELVSMEDCHEKITPIDVEQFLEKDVLFFARRECGKTIFLEKLALENNEIAYVDCRDMLRVQESADEYFRRLAHQKIGDKSINDLIVILDHLKINDSNELRTLRRILLEKGRFKSLIVPTNNEFLMNSALNNKNVSSFRKVRMRSWGVKTIEEFAIKFWAEKFPGQVPRIDYLKNCLAHSDLPITPVIVGVYISLYAMTDNSENSASLTNLIDRIADVRFGARKQDYVDIVIEFACELFGRNADEISLEDFKELIVQYFESRNLDYNLNQIIENLIESKFILLEDDHWVRFPYYVFRDYFIAQAIAHRRIPIEDLTATDVNILANASPLILYGAIARNDTSVLTRLFGLVTSICTKQDDHIIDFDLLDGFISYLVLPRQQSISDEQTAVEEERSKRNRYKSLQDEFEENRRRHDEYRETQRKLSSSRESVDGSFIERLVFMLNAVYNLYRNLETISAKSKEAFLERILDFHVYCNLMMIQSFKEIAHDKEFRSIVAYVVTMGGEIFMRLELFSPSLRKTISNVLGREKNDFKRFLLISLFATGRFDGYERLIEEFAKSTHSFAAIEMVYFKVRHLLVTSKEEHIPDRLIKLFQTVVKRRNQIFREKCNDISGELSSVKKSHYANFHWEDKRLK